MSMNDPSINEVKHRVPSKEEILRWGWLANHHEWPTEIKRTTPDSFWWFLRLNWVQRLLFRWLVRGRIEFLVNHAEAMVLIRTTQAIYGEKECLRFHNCVAIWGGRDKPNMTEDEFELWWNKWHGEDEG